MTNSRIGQVPGKDTILECRITAFPLAVNIWQKDGVRITSSVKYTIDAYDEGDHTITLSLRIRNIEVEDYGQYTCVAANPHGRDQEHTWLYRKFFVAIGSAISFFQVLTYTFLFFQYWIQ